MPTDPPCKNCRRPTHPLYIRKYHGYCLDCSNAGVPELHDHNELLRKALAELLRADDDWHGSVNSEMAKARNAARAALTEAKP